MKKTKVNIIAGDIFFANILVDRRDYYFEMNYFFMEKGQVKKDKVDSGYLLKVI